MTEYGERYPPCDYRVIVVKDDPKAFRPWRWTVEERRFDEWDFKAEGRAVSRVGAWRKAHRRACALPWQVDREEALIKSDSAIVRTEPPPARPAPIESKFLP